MQRLEVNGALRFKGLSYFEIIGDGCEFTRDGDAQQIGKMAWQTMTNAVT